MIPKLIYTTWCSPKPFPKEFEYNLSTWKRLMPDFKIEILTTATPNRFITEARKKGKHVLVGHWARCETLYRTGGIYMDIDVELIKPLNEFLDKEMFLGYSGVMYANNALFGCKPGHTVLKECMEFMENFDLNCEDPENGTGPKMFDEIIQRRGFKRPHPSDGSILSLDMVTVYPPKYFYPFCYDEKFTPKCIKPETHAIHWWGTTWSLKDGVSVVIPCYNHAKLLPRAIESAMALRSEKEIIVVDDGSKDDTESVAKRYPVVYLFQGNQGLASARNLGISVAQKKIIFPLDADDEAIPTGVDSLVSGFGDADVVYGNSLINGNPENKFIPQKDFTLEDLMVWNELFSCALFKRTLWERLNGYWVCPTQKNYAEDWDFWGRAKKIGAKFQYQDVDFHRYYQTPDGMCLTMLKDELSKAKLRTLVTEHIKAWEAK